MLVEIVLHCSRRMYVRGIGAVVYKVPELGKNEMLKVSLRSIGNEDTASISQVLALFTFHVFLRVIKYSLQSYIIYILGIFRHLVAVGIKMPVHLC